MIPRIAKIYFEPLSPLLSALSSFTLLKLLLRKTTLGTRKRICAHLCGHPWYLW